MSGHPPTRPATGVPLFVGLSAALLLAALPMCRAVATPGATVALAAATVVPVVAAVLARRWRLADGPAALVQVVAVAAVVAVAVRATPQAVVAEVLREPTRLLVDTLPLADPAAVALPALLTAVSAAAAGHLASRGRAGRALAVPPAVAAAGWALTGRAGSPPTWAVAGLALALVLTVAARHEAARPTTHRAPTRRRLTVATVAAAATGSAAFVVPPVLAAPAPLTRVAPTRTVVVADPVDDAAARRRAATAADPGTRLVVRTDAATDGLLRVAVTDRYDGASWSLAARFVPSGGRLARPTAATAAVGQQIEIDGELASGLLPALAQPVSVSGAAVGVDEATGTLAVLGPPPRRYRVESAPTRLAGDLDGGSRLATAAGPLLPGGAAPVVATVVASISAAVGRAPSPTVGWFASVAALLARVDRLAEPGMAAGGAEGTSLAAVVGATTAQRVASPEQFATLVAVVARSIGVPARLAVGYRLGGTQAGTYRVDDRDLTTWVELPVVGRGWVALDPTPPVSVAVSPPPPLAVSSSPDPTLRQPAAVARPVRVSGGGRALAPAADPAAAARRHGGWLRPAVGVAGAAAVLAGWALWRTVVAVRRRRRRRLGDPRRRCTAAWAAIVDLLAAAGLAPPASATVAEVVADVRAAFGSAAADAVAATGALAERAVYSSTGLADDEAEVAWMWCRRAATVVRAGLGRRQRLAVRLRAGLVH